MEVLGKWWHQEKDGRKKCDLCPRGCTMQTGQKGFCFVREAKEDGIYLTTYGRSSGFCIDPIEKKPLNHFYPGSSVLSFGTAGCNLGCKFCQNWDISKAKTQDRLMSAMMPNEIAALAQQYHSKSVAYTYNDPVIFAEYAIDTAKECRKRGIKNVAVSAGYITEQAREEFFEVMDAANIDLKGFTNEFYQKQSMAELKPVLNTLEYIVNHTKTWLEITTLLIPTLNDSDEELNHMTQWIRDYLGSNVPLHFSAFHPDFKLQNFEHTPKQTLIRAREIALKNGLNHVYVGNVHDKKDSSTYCSSCKKLLIERDWFELGEFHIKDGLCEFCLTKLPGIFENEIGQWGSKRIPISL